MQNFLWHNLNQTSMELNRVMNLELVLKLFRNVVPCFPLFTHFTSLSTPVGGSRELRPIILKTLLSIFKLHTWMKFLNGNKLQVLK